MNENQIELNPSTQHESPGFTESSLIPLLGDALKPLALLGIRGVIGIVDCTKSTVQLVREEVEDIVAEAQFERLKQQMNKEIEMADGGLEKESE